MPKLHTIIASTRPGRIGPSVAQWFHDFAIANGKFEAELVDLAEFNLPLYDEPHHPTLKKYQHEHTKRWSASVAAADAFVIVTPEYNFSAPPSLVNALDYLYGEWSYKPVAFVSYGGVSGGMRSVQTTKLHVTTLKMVPLVEAVTIPFVWQHLNESGVFTPNDHHLKSAGDLLAELHRWSEALRTLRA
jgi:NAD(P)H-dependent FMN reductase